MTNPKRPESLDLAIANLEMTARGYQSQLNAGGYFWRLVNEPRAKKRIAELDDALAVLRAERERRELEEAGQMTLGEEAE